MTRRISRYSSLPLFRRTAACLVAVLAAAGVSVHAQATGSIEIAWDANLTDSDLAGYRIYVDDDPNTFGLTPSAAKPLAFRTMDVSTAITDQIVTNLDTSKVWFFGVTCLDTSGNESGFSNIVNKQPGATPTVRSVSPTSTLQGSTSVAVTVTGTNFTATSTVSFGPNVTVTNVNTSGAPTTLVATINVDSLAQANTRAVTVTNSVTSSGSKSQAFTIGVREKRCDIDGSGRIDGADFSHILLGFPSFVGDADYSTNIDLDVDGKVDGADLAIFFSFFGAIGPFP